MDIRHGEPEVTAHLSPAEARLIEGWAHQAAQYSGAVILNGLVQRVESAREAVSPPVDKSEPGARPSNAETIAYVRDWQAEENCSTPEERASLQTVATTFSLYELLFLRQAARNCIDHHLPFIIDAQAENKKLDRLSLDTKENQAEDPEIAAILAQPLDARMQGVVTNSLYARSVSHSKVALNILNSVNGYFESQAS